MPRLSWWPVHNRPQRLIKAVQSCFPASNPPEWFSAGCIFRWKFHRPKSNVPKVTRILKAIKSSQPHPQAPKISRLDQLASNWLGGATVPVWRPLHRPPEGIAAHASTSSWHNMATPLNMVKIRFVIGRRKRHKFPSGGRIHVISAVCWLAQWKSRCTALKIENDVFEQILILVFLWLSPFLFAEVSAERGRISCRRRGNQTRSVAKVTKT